ncbi:hypothetical protein PRIPAC_72111 [Pristionchus pacificus]|uniref:Uncharacterized protein n=1 Tax=Pristionchus pacificus TaxID=54126 RepID=A0A2A6CAI0_PRIPA|nr:hypothetical protein PRIPAC_72111 [Pristionchus pacificus]|eukprot:PDM75078.1 hypothetical protein PRIPAC_40459 [Pristionchus pacificus]
MEGFPCLEEIKRERERRGGVFVWSMNEGKKLPNEDNEKEIAPNRLTRENVAAIMLLLEEMEALWKNERDEKEMENEDEKRRHKVPIRMRFEEESEHGGTYFLH